MFKSKVYVTLKLSKILLGKKNDRNECVKLIVNLFQKKSQPANKFNIIKKFI